MSSSCIRMSPSNNKPYEIAKRAGVSPELVAKMADQNSGNESILITLNEVFVAKRKLRYIYLCHPNVISTVWEENCECIPLFLGTDVLGNCNISQSNLPRIHAKHATKGLATKVNFPPCAKVYGIHGTGRGVWFYSIQGIFRIAFEYYDRLEQDGCLTELEKVWRSCLLNPALKSEMHVVLGKVMEQPSQDEPLGNTAIVDKSPEKSLGTSVEVQNEDLMGIEGDTRTCGDRSNILNKIKKHVDQMIMETQSPTLQQDLELLKNFVTFLHGNNASFVNSIVNMFKNCLALLPTVSESCDFIEKDNVLSEVAGWLGTEFACLHSHVSEKVTSFKQRHIRSIENLPCAEVLISEVFPMSMQILLRCWLRQSDDQIPSTSNNQDEEVVFPVIQIILELANRNLLSGVAHVLYSRLILSEKV